MFEFVPRDLELGMQLEKFVRMEMRAAMNFTGGVVIGGIHTLLSGTAPQDFPEQAAATVLMGLGVDRKTKIAKMVAYAKLKSLKIDGDGLIARTLTKTIADR